MYRYRRLVLIDRFIPFLATGVGLVALLAVMAAQLDSGARRTALDADVAAARAAIASATASLAAAPVAPVEAAPADDAAVAALDERVARLEADLAAARSLLDTAAAAGVTPRPLPADVAVATEGTNAFEDALPLTPATAAGSAAIDPSLPTTDCIPLGTRFMATPNDNYPICQSKTVIKVGAITSDSVDVAGAGPIPATGFSALPGTTCTVMVFSANIEGFAELRVTCS